MISLGIKVNLSGTVNEAAFMTCTEAEQRYEHERIRAGRNTVMYGNMVFFTTVPH